MQRAKRFFSRLFGKSSSRRLARTPQRRLGHFEELEKRTLLSITPIIAGQVQVGYTTTQLGPIPAAYLTVSYIASNNLPYMATNIVTAADGTYSVPDPSPNLTLKPNSIVTATVYAGSAGVSQYWVNNPSAGNTVWKQGFEAPARVPSPAPATFQFNINVAAVYNTTNAAFQIYSTVQNVYAAYATQQLGATFADRKENGSELFVKLF